MINDMKIDLVRTIIAIGIVSYNNDYALPQQEGIIHTLLGLVGTALCYIFSRFLLRPIKYG